MGNEEERIWYHSGGMGKWNQEIIYLWRVEMTGKANFSVVASRNGKTYDTGLPRAGMRQIPANFHS